MISMLMTLAGLWAAIYSPCNDEDGLPCTATVLSRSQSDTLAWGKLPSGFLCIHTYVVPFPFSLRAETGSFNGPD